MPKHPISQTTLPSRWEFSHGTYYYRVPKHLRDQWDGKTKFPLGRTLGEAYAEWYRRVEPVDLRTMSDAMARYSNEVLPMKAPRTQVDYAKAVERLQAVFGHMLPREVLPMHVYGYMSRLKPVQANRDRAVLSAIMTKCVRWGLVERNLVREVERNEEEPRDRYVTDAEATAFRKHCNAFLKAYIDLKLLTGLRQGQLLALQRGAWDGERLTAPKVKRGKTVTYRDETDETELSDAIAAVLALRKGRAIRSMFLFATRLGGQYTGDGFRSIWQRAMAKHIKAGGAHFTEHDLRAKVGSDSETLNDATDRMGHRNSGTTSRVYRRRPTDVTVLRAAQHKRESK